MRILDRYIARLLLVNFVTLLVIVSSMIVAIDVVINLDRFARRADQIAAGAGALHHGLLTGLLVVDLWGPRLLQLFVYLSGVALIGALGFTAAQLVRHREFVAMLSSGISLHRAARPFVLVALGVTVCQAVVQEVAIPAVAHLLPRDPGDSGKRALNAFAVRLAPDEQGRLWYAPSFDDATGVLEEPVIWERSEEGALLRTIAAKAARWDGSGWVLEEGVARTPMSPDATASARPAAVERLETSLDPARLKVRHLQGFASNLSWRQIDEMLSGGGLDAAARERLNRLRWGRVSGLVSGFVATIGAMALFLVRTPRPMLGPSLRAAPVALAGVGAAAVASSAAVPGLPVWFGAFVPCLVLTSLSIALYTGVET
ncbi:MAG: LptF/LptG family permease [Planctomycetota bacterium]|nr:LptF/LptG family permease [Planctomycetota bacterium]